MRIYKNINILLIFLLLASWPIYNIYAKDTVFHNGEKTKRVALVVKMKKGDYWKIVKMGADAASKELNVTLDFTAPDDEEDIEGQKELINKIIDKNVDALILAPSDYEGLTDIIEKAYDKKIPVIIIDSEVNTDKIHSFIATDNFDAGKKAGQKLAEMMKNNGKVAIMGFVKGTGNGEQREKGFLSILSQYPKMKVVAKEYCLSDTEFAAELTKKMIRENKDIDGFVALNAISSVGVGKAIDELNMGGKIKVITFDSTTEEIELLEKGVIQATIVQNPFTMGYLGVKYAVQAVEGEKIPKHVDTGSSIIDCSNMYLPENQKLLFPFVK